MKKTTLIFGLAVSLAFAAVLLAQQQPTTGGGAHLGTWELVATKYGNAKEFSDYPKEHRRLKMLTATHFTWVDYDPESGNVNSMAGGPYSLKEGVYTETVEFIGKGMETYLGKKQTFTIKVDGDKLSQSCQLSDEMKIEEIWRRVK